ncbi:MAG: T9SS type A sorting domain-containing protein [Flavobacteriia bacterium]|nr:T9SS type A sorting domain-containing protein [Flavobacteriia bacterium]
MKKFLLSLVVALVSLSSYGTHIKGGQIYWDALGNNQYDIYVELIRDPTGVAMPANATLDVGGTSVSAAMQTFNKYPAGCGVTDGYEVYIYKATNVTMNVTAGSNVKVAYDECCRPITDNVSGSGNLYLESTLHFAGANMSSPRFDFYNHYDEGSKRLFLPVINTNGLATSVSLAEPLVSASTSVTYNTGFSFTNPTSSNDLLLGNTFYVGASTQGAYLTAFDCIATDMNGQATSTVQADIRIVTTIAPGASNNPPSISLTNTSGWTTQDSVLYSKNVMAGDSVMFRIQAFDNDFLPNFIPQTITASLRGGASLPGSYSLSPVAPQSGLSNSLTNITDFLWVVPQGISPGTYSFAVYETDDNCPRNGVNSLQFEVTVASVDVDTFGICTGGAVSMQAPTSGSTYAWAPATGLSSTSTAVTVASPSATTTYTCHVDGNLVAEYTVEVNAPIKPIGSQPQPNQIELTNVSSFDNHAFLYGYVPFSFNSTIVTISNSGVYHIVGQKGGCFTISDSIVVASDSASGVYLINNPLSGDDFTVFDNQSIYSMDITIGGIDATLAVEEIVIPGATLSGKTGGVRLIVADGVGNTQTVNGVQAGDEAVSFDLPSVAYLIQASANPKLTLVIDSGALELPLLEAQSLPYSINNLATVTSSTTSRGAMSTSGDIVPFIFKGTFEVGLDENVLESVLIYPQPAEDFIQIDGVEGQLDYKIIDMNGRVLMQGTTESNRIDVSAIRTGMYILSLSNEDAQRNVNVVIR